MCPAQHDLSGTFFLNLPLAAGFYQRYCLVAGGLQLAGFIGLAELYNGMIAVDDLRRQNPDVDMNEFWSVDALFACCPQAFRASPAGGLKSSA